MKNVLVARSVLGKSWIAAPVSENPDLIKNILAARGIVGQDAAARFLNPKISESMPDPFVLRDMQRGIVIAGDAIIAGKKIGVFGDYDVDGITSAAILVRFLRMIGADPAWHLPDRDTEGYGLNNAAITEFAAAGVGLMITVDCGISGHAEIEFAKTLGIETIVTDHHPDDSIPDALAVIDPKRPDDESGLGYLAGVGVAFMFVVALKRELAARGYQMPEINMMDFVDLVALGTICDMMPLVGLNRAFVKTGLQTMRQTKNLGLQSLMTVSDVKVPSVYAAGFILGPRLNAAGRLDSANPALELLLCDNPMAAMDFANLLNATNARRIDKTNGILLHATEIAEKIKDRNHIFICQDDWPKGFMGIIAGRIKDKFNLPTLVATRLGDEINGSGRSIPQIDLGAIIRGALAAGILSEGGGHSVAAGFSLRGDRMEDFQRFLSDQVELQLAGAEIISEINVDLEIDSAGATRDLVNKMSALAPFGQANPEPVLVLNNAFIGYCRAVGTNHVSGVFRNSVGGNLSFIGFNLADSPIGRFLLDDSNTGRRVILCGKLKENDYNGRKDIQFVLEDMAV
ncbi:MAG: single-stranded-DNA-specific exonuclease RecJ [Rickettsiales bacterium]|jgi:single-stranded-DNA-specific exonuclease|nr:single-stranded-DNA-specific exonuclease RecJ [Rickettsiales bacterium]